MNRESHLRGGGLAAWSVRHPIGITMIAAAVMALGLFAFGRLSVDLLPHIIYPEIRVRILDPGVPARIMEDQVTRQLEEQLAITEDAISVQSRSNEGASSVDLAFEYGKDIDVALRDASTRLDRAKRFLPDTIQPPVIYKRDPSQIPVAEFVLASALGRDPVALRDWADYEFTKQFLNLPGVAAVEVGGGLVREIQVLPDQQRLAAVGLSVDGLVEALRRANVEEPAGRVTMARRELSGRTAARFGSVAEIAALPLPLKDGSVIRLGEVARVLDTHADERLRVRLDGLPGVKISIQKQPTANTVAVVDAVNQRLKQLTARGFIPADVVVERVADQAVYVRNALNNASLAALGGTLLAMAVVYLFLGNLRRTLIIGSAIPLAVMVTFVLMGFGGLTFNIMTLGGLALGVGMLVDNTIVMLENIYRHQRQGQADLEAGREAAREINSAIVASTSTNLAAVLPFLFLSGLVGLLFRDLIFTISAAILASMVVALTLVPALAVRVPVGRVGRLRTHVDASVDWLQRGYSRLVGGLLRHPLLQAGMVAVAIATLAASLPVFTSKQTEFLPKLDDGQVRVSITADPGVSLDEMDHSVRIIEKLIRQRPEVDTVFTLVGGFIFGRTERESPNRSTLTVQLVPRQRRPMSNDDWAQQMQRQIGAENLAGIKVRIYTRGIRGIRLGRGDDDISLRLQGPDLDTLARLGDEVVNRLRGTPGLRNLTHSAEESNQELAVVIDRPRAAALSLDPEQIAVALRRSLAGEEVTDFIEGDHSYAVRLRLPREEVSDPTALEQVLLAPSPDRPPVHLGDVARVELTTAPAEILRDNQQRIVEISASLEAGATLGGAYGAIHERLADFSLPTGYTLYDGGELRTLQESERQGQLLLALAVFLVLVVMAVQYESIRNPLVIMLSVPFAATGVAVGLTITGLPLSMPVWLGMIMLAGIVVNNAIVLVEYMELARARGADLDSAIVEAARLRLRPILMTTLTTVFGMLPLALGVGEGAEMLQPLAVALIGGLALSLLVSLVLIPILYRFTHRAGSARLAT